MTHLASRLMVMYDTYSRPAYGGTWAVSPPPLPTLPAANLSDLRRAVPCRVTGTDMTLTLSLPAAQPVAAAGLVGANLTASATVTLAGHTADSWGAPAYGPTTLTVWDTLGTGALFWPLPAAQTYQYWRFVLSDPANPDGYVEVGVPMLGPLYDHGSLGPRPSTLARRPRTLLAYAADRTPYRWPLASQDVMSVPSNIMTRDQVFGAGGLWETVIAVGPDRDMLVTLYGNDPGEDAVSIRHTRYAHLDPSLPAMDPKQLVIYWEANDLQWIES